MDAEFIAKAKASAADDDGILPEPEDDDVEEDVDNFQEGTSDDWRQMAEGLRQRKLEAKAAKLAEREDADADAFDDESNGPMCGRMCCLYFAAAMLALLSVAAYQAWQWFNPAPVSCSLELVRPQKFKVDVTDFFAPRVSAAVQLVLQLKNPNLLRSMLLEHCKLTAYDDETGLKLGSVQQGSLVLQPFSTTQVTVTLNQMGSSLPSPEQRSLASAFLSKKALLLTLVATASSRIPKRGSNATTVTSNATRRVDMSSLTKEPFFQRAAPPPDANAAGATPEKPADVPNA